MINDVKLVKLGVFAYSVIPKAKLFSMWAPV